MEEPAAASAAVLQPSRDVDISLPELSRSQTTLDDCFVVPESAATRRRSLRPRPSEALLQQDALLPLALSPTTSQPPERQLRSRSSKMSLFSLFSKPKVEKQRGYAESGLERSSTQHATPLATAAPLKRDVVVRVESVNTVEGERTRPSSSRSNASKRPRLYTSKEPLPPIPHEHRTREFDPPPLFQVWPQAIKSATLEVPASSTNLSGHKTKSRIAGTLLAPSNEAQTGRADPRTTTHSRNGSTSSVALPLKAIVLTTSGHLLQYAETGPSDRSPEKILQLGKQSAAFASDRIPGKHHVLQVAQAVDSSGCSVRGSQTLLSRFGIRRPPSSRLTSTFLLVMSGPDELNDWMTAVKSSIADHGGQRARSVSAASRSQSSHQQPEVTRTPSASHRLQVKRDPEGPSLLTTPKFDALPSLWPSVPHTESAETRLASAPGPAIAVAKEVKTPDAEDESTKTRPRAPSDCGSTGSSTALSVEQQPLEKLRSSVRMSLTSTIATSVPASRTNSFTSSPSDQYADGIRDSFLPKSTHRNRSSYALAKRRSGAQLSPKDLRRGTKPAILMHQQRLVNMDSSVDSPVLETSPPIPEPSPYSRQNRLSSARSTPDFKATSGTSAKHDSKLLLSPTEARPESIVAELPSPALWTTSRPSPAQPLMSSTSPFPPLLDLTTAKNIDQTGSSASRTSPTSRLLRTGSNSFSIPRSPPLDSSPRRPQRRSPSDAQEEVEHSPIPAVHTLTAKVDVATRTRIDASYIPARKSSTSGSPPSIRSAKRDLPAKLSLFPGAQPAPALISLQTGALRRSPSSAGLSPHVHAQPTIGPTNQTRLARPASLQVRANHTPFVSAIRSPNNVVGAPSFSSTVPIRSLRPSRSVATMQTTTLSSPTVLSSFVPSNLHADTIDEATSPSSEVTSATPSRKKRSLCDFKQTVDISSLGPPAPPPSAPLPDIPTVDGDSEMRSSKTRLSIIRTGTPTGEAIGQALENEFDILPPKELKPNEITGLGVAVTAEKEDTRHDESQLL